MASDTMHWELLGRNAYEHGEAASETQHSCMLKMRIQVDLQAMCKAQRDSWFSVRDAQSTVSNHKSMGQRHLDIGHEEGFEIRENVTRTQYSAYPSSQS